VKTKAQAKKPTSNTCHFSQNHPENIQYKSFLVASPVMRANIGLWMDKKKSYNPKTISFEEASRYLFLDLPRSTSLVYMCVVKNLVPKLIIDLTLVGTNELIQNRQ
jgi:hypothetical protein